MYYYFLMILIIRKISIIGYQLRINFFCDFSDCRKVFENFRLALFPKTIVEMLKRLRIHRRQGWYRFLESLKLRPLPLHHAISKNSKLSYVDNSLYNVLLINRMRAKKKKRRIRHRRRKNVPMVQGKKKWKIFGAFARRRSRIYVLRITRGQRQRNICARGKRMTNMRVRQE